MNETLKNQWISILEGTDIDKRHYDKVLSYVEMYIVNENLYGHIMSEPISKKDWIDLGEKILPLSLKVFEHIDLDKVEFVGYPMDLDTYLLEVTGDGDTDVNIVNELVQTINDNFSNEHWVKIYRVINSIFKKDDKIEIYSRFKFIKNN